MPHQSIGIFACLLAIGGMYWARGVMALGVIVLLGNALVSNNVVSIFIQLKKHAVLLSIIGLFLVYAISGFWSSNHGYFFHKIQLHLPFLALPIGIFSMGKIKQQQMFYLLSFFIACTVIASWVSAVQYFSAKEMYDAGYGFSHVIPTPFKKDHIRFSIAVVLAIFFAVWCLQIASHQLAKWCLIIAAIWLIIYLHILSVKTGLLSFYISTFVAVIGFSFQQKNKKVLFTGLLSLLLLPLLAYQFSTTFKNKIGYLRYSIEQIKNTTTQANISDEGRIVSYQVFKNVYAKNILIGVGAGDVFDAMQVQYQSQFRGAAKNITVLLPHNQLMVFLLVAGLIGGLAYGVFLLLPFFYKRYRTSLLFVVFWTILLIPQMVEPLFETQYGIALHLFFYVLIIRFIDTNHKPLYAA